MEGKGMEGKGREGKGREGKGREGKGRDVREGKGCIMQLDGVASGVVSFSWCFGPIYRVV